jgi:hypothetical protein
MNRFISKKFRLIDIELRTVTGAVVMNLNSSIEKYLCWGGVSKSLC